MNSNPAGASETREETLNRILGGLQGKDDAGRLSALAELEGLGYSSPAILQEIERMAIGGRGTGVQDAARRLLGTAAHRYIRAQQPSLPRSLRDGILHEIEAWRQQGLIAPEQAEVLRSRYGAEATPASPVQAKPAPAVPSAPAARPASAESAAPASSASLTERFLSQASINIFLYLGAFLVIGAALILAALVQSARMPILLAVAVIFSGSAIALKRRLPQPSFALFIVFSFLLPIIANVLADSLALTGRADNAYWAAVFLVMTLIWGFSTWFYSSRLFSVAAFLSLTLAVLRIGGLFQAPVEWGAFCGTAAALCGLGGTWLLRTWKDARFALPQFIAAQIVAGLALFISLGSLLANLGLPDGSPANWIPITLTWMAGAAFYAWSAILNPFPLFPWAAAAAMMPVSWMALHIAETSSPAQIAGLWTWAGLYAAASEFLARRTSKASVRFSLPFLLGSLPLFAVAAAWGGSEQVGYACAALAGAAIVYGTLHMLRPRGLVWAGALTFGLGAYFTMFELRFMQAADVPFSYQALGASVLLLAPELFFKSPLTSKESWRWPPFVLGTLVTLANLGPLLLAEDGPGVSAIAMGFYSLLFAAQALHFRRRAMGYLATGAAALALRFALLEFDSNQWLPALTGLALAYFACGYLLRSKEKTAGWGSMLRISGLVLGSILSLGALVTTPAGGGWYAAAVAMMFVIETVIRPEDRLEPVSLALFTIAAALFVHDLGVKGAGYRMLAFSLIWLMGDAAYSRRQSARRAAMLTRLVAAALTAGTSLLAIFGGMEYRTAAVCFGAFTLVFALDAWIYRQPNLIYPAAAALPLSVLFVLRELRQPDWLPAMIAIAAAYYAVGYILRRRRGPDGWSRALLFSGLGLAALNSLSAPLQAGLGAAVPVAVAASLFAAEAFAQRNVALAFPANLLYLEAYFLILIWLKVDQPQFFSVGTAALGMLMHYLLRRAGSKAGAFLTGMFSQLVLLGTTYIQLLATSKLGFFAVLFFQALAVLWYGLAIRSRSLVATPIVFIVLAVVSVVYSALKGISTVVLIGCTGVILLLLGILGVVLRERLTRIGERFSDWQS